MSPCLLVCLSNRWSLHSRSSRLPFSLHSILVYSYLCSACVCTGLDVFVQYLSIGAELCHIISRELQDDIAWRPDWNSVWSTWSLRVCVRSSPNSNRKETFSPTPTAFWTAVPLKALLESFKAAIGLFKKRK